MKISVLAVSLVLAMSIAATAQQSNTYKVKKSTPEKPASSGVVAVPAPSANSSASTARELQVLEQQTVKSSGASAAATKKPSNAAPPVQLIKDQHNPPINFAGNISPGSGQTTAPSNPYAGRLKQKTPGKR
jgi:hypothetical protein